MPCVWHPPCIVDKEFIMRYECVADCTDGCQGGWVWVTTAGGDQTTYMGWLVQQADTILSQLW